MKDPIRMYRLVGVLNMAIAGANIYVPAFFVRGGLSLLGKDNWVTGPLSDNFVQAFAPYAFLSIGMGMALLGISGLLLLLGVKSARILSIASAALLCLPSWVMALTAYLLGNRDVGPEAAKFLIRLPFIAHDTSATMFFTLYVLLQALIYYSLGNKSENIK